MRPELLPENREAAERAILAACGVFGVNRLALLGRGKTGPAWAARAAFSLSLHEQAGVTWSQVGAVLGREHSAPRALVTRLRRLMKADKQLREQVERVVGTVRDWAAGRGEAA